MNYKCIKKNSRGFTLIELLLAVGITSIILLSLVFFSQTILETQVKQTTIREVNEQGELIMEKILRTIHDAESVTEPLPGNSSNNLFLSSALGPIEITLDNEMVYFEQNNLVALHNDRIRVTDLQFINRAQVDAWDTIDISLTIEYASPSNRIEYNYQKQWQSTAVIRQYD